MLSSLSNSGVLLLSYVLMMHGRAGIIGPKHLRFTGYEVVFIIYSIGWTLDEVASVTEHGWTVHTENMVVLGRCLHLLDVLWSQNAWGIWNDGS